LLQQLDGALPHLGAAAAAAAAAANTGCIRECAT
jgi:hypothetical protein